MSTPRGTPAQADPSLTEGVPPGLILVPIGKGCVLLLLEVEYVRAIQRGKRWRRRRAVATRRGAKP